MNSTPPLEVAHGSSWRPGVLGLSGDTVFWAVTLNPSGEGVPDIVLSRVLSVAKSGGAITQLWEGTGIVGALVVSGHGVHFSVGRTLINVDAGSVTQQCEILLAPLEGGTVETRASQATCGGLALDDTHLYWAGSDDAGSAIFRQPLVGGAVDVVTPTEWQRDVVVDDQHVSWFRGQSLMVCDKGACTPRELHSFVENGLLTHHGEFLYVGLPLERTLQRVNKATGATSVLLHFPSERYPWQVAMDAAGAVWTTHRFVNADGGGAVMDFGNQQVVSATPDGQVVKILALPQPWPGYLALDATHVFWTDVQAQSVFAAVR